MVTMCMLLFAYSYVVSTGGRRMRLTLVCAKSFTCVLLLQIVYPEDPKTKSLGLDFYATNVNIAAVVKHIWSSAPTFLLDFISPIAFSDVAIGYHADKYTILAHPDVSHSPLLAKVLEVSRA